MSRIVTLKAFSLSGFSFPGGTATVPASAVTHVGVRVSDLEVVMTPGSVNVDRTVIWLATVTANATDITLVVEHDPLIQIELGELAPVSGAQFINFDTTPAGVPATPGTLFWDAEQLCLAYHGATPGTVMQIGRELWARCRNNSGVTIPEGRAVVVTGAIGGFPTIRLATAATDTHLRTLGVATETIANNAFGEVTTSGDVNGLNTSAWAEGDVLYLGVTPGELVTAPPGDPNYAVSMGMVLRSHVNQGRISIRVQGTSTWLDPDTLTDATLNGSERVAIKQAGSWFRATMSNIGAFVTGIYTITVHAGVGAVARTLLAVLRDQPVSIKNFGAVADWDGTDGTDNTVAIQNALDFVNAAGGGAVLIPSGKFRKADTSASLVMHSNTTLMGYGDSSVLVFDDRPTNPVIAYFLSANNVSNIAFKDFRIEGTILTYRTATNQKQLLTGSNIDGLKMSGVTIYGCRAFATAFTKVKNASFVNNHLEYVLRDGIRCTHSYNVTIVGNTFKRVSDNPVALHSKDEFTETVPSGFTVSCNVFEECDTLSVLGAKSLNITGNTIRRSLSHGIYVGIPGAAYEEGNTTMLSINISDNIINDCLAFYSNSAIRILSYARNNGGLTGQPGVTVAPYPYNYVNDTDEWGRVVVGTHSLNISNNIIQRTLPIVARYSDWGYGELFDRNVPGFFHDPEITEGTLKIHGISITEAVGNVRLAGNLISGLGTGMTAVLFNITSSGNVIDANNVVIESNNFVDCPGVGVSMSAVGAGAKNIIIRNNIFDLDPYFRNAAHNADNTWSTSGTVLGVLAGTSISAAFIEGNTFKNLGTPFDVILANSVVRGNYIYTNPVADGDNAGNKGVRNLNSLRDSLFVVFDATPTSPTYGRILTMPAVIGNSVPGTGTYVKGHYIRNAWLAVLGTAGSRYVVAGWHRLTTGSTHVLNTDWVELRCLTGT